MINEPMHAQRSQVAADLNWLSKLRNDPLFQRLEERHREFNIFESIGAQRRELRHSDFLAFLLNPYESHRLGSKFIQIFLSQLLSTSQARTLAPYGIQSGKFDDAEVRREWHNIDILLLFQRQCVACIIENKIDDHERGKQLEDYYNDVQNTFSGWKIVGVYLTPNAEPPSNEKYIAVGYRQISDAIRNLLKSLDRKRCPDDLPTTLKHYDNMIHKHIVQSPEVEKECWKIYTEHKHAIDLIREYVEATAQIHGYLKDLISKAGLDCPHHRKGYVQFRPREWEKAAFPNSNRSFADLLFFEFQYAQEQLGLYLVIDKKPNGTRDPGRMFQIAQENTPPFQIGRQKLTNYTKIFGKQLLSRNQFTEMDFKDQKKRVEAGWQEFLRQDLPVLKEVVTKYSTII
jgi:hypothetical protein